MQHVVEYKVLPIDQNKVGIVTCLLQIQWVGLTLWNVNCVFHQLFYVNNLNACDLLEPIYESIDVGRYLCMYQIKKNLNLEAI